MALMHVLLALFVLAILGQAQDNRCDNGPCKIGCCNEFGWCGYGPKFCGANTCKSDCERKSECNPGFGSEWALRDKCPLNVCCSEHGFCGTTKDFCGDKKVSHKTCSKNNGNNRVVGYYEGWAKDRSCNVFTPEQIPIGIYTHINFAFGIIDPQTFKIAPSSPDDVNLYKRLMLLKQRDPSLKVYIAVGGWAFNDPGPTASTFSDLAASVPRQKIFMESVISFMSTYGFDGLDLDWEYPVADDRSGREVDFDNFPKFMARLKETLAGSSKGLTITLPASYWYLQHFDLTNLVKSVDWFNIMSYDLHGTWDQGNKWTGAFLNSHTNLTEIDLALDLLWRNDIDPSKVVLGLGFYGRTFTVTSESCKTPGCTYQSGGQKGKCSKEVGILLNSEIDDLVKENSVTPVLYKTEAAKVATWGNQWVAYDDEETLIMKSEYAQQMCLGGLMVWAISHDTQDAKYHKALAKAANRKILSLPMTDGSGNAFEDLEVPQDQCKWTNCGDSCPSGWVHIKRSDERGKKDEYMYDESPCGPKGVTNFCCPPGGAQPSCGWYTQKNGNCDSTCPKDMIEIGSYNKNCKKTGTYQSACCNSNYKSMKLYTKGEWGKYPMCEETSSCPASDSKKSELLGSANAGSGQAICNAYYKGHVLPKDPPNERKFCYDGSNKKERFSDCVWYGGVGTMLPGAPKDWCLSGCPSNRVRIGLGYDKKCANFSYRALCCVPHMVDVIQIENPKLQSYRDALAEYIKNPRCEVPAPFSKRDSTLLVKREQKFPYDMTGEILLKLLTLAGGGSAMMSLMEEAWNAVMGNRYSNLHFPSLREFTQKLHTWTTRGPIELAQQIMCNLNYWNSRAAKKGTMKTLVCVDMSCDAEDCGEDIEPQRLVRRISEGQPAEPFSHGHQRHHHHHRHNIQQRSAEHDSSLSHFTLQKREERDYKVEVIDSSGTKRTITITLPSYYDLSDLDEDHYLKDEVVDYDDVDDCGNPTVARYELPENPDPPPVGRIFEMEHVMDGQLIGRFMREAALGQLASGATTTIAGVSISYFETARTQPIHLGASALPGGASPDTDPDLRYVYARVMECLGSEFNTASFVALVKQIHAVKTKLMQGKRPMSLKNTDTRTGSGIFEDAQYVLGKIRAAIATIRYLSFTSKPNVHGHLTTIVNNIGTQWKLSQSVYNAANPNDKTTIGDFWSVWVKDFYEKYLVGKARAFCREAIDKLRETWTDSENEGAQGILDALTALDTQLKDLKIDTTGWK